MWDRETWANSVVPADRSMQLHMRLGPPCQRSGDGIKPDLQRAVQRRLVHLVERAIHQARDISLDQHALPGEEAHQAADRREFSERNQRAEITVDERFDRLTFQSALDLLQEVGRLLVRRLRARRNGPFLAVRHQIGAIAHGKDIVVARRLQGWADDELTRRARLQAIKVLQYVGTAYAGRPDWVKAGVTHETPPGGWSVSAIASIAGILLRGGM